MNSGGDVKVKGGCRKGDEERRSKPLPKLQQQPSATHLSWSDQEILYRV